MQMQMDIDINCFSHTVDLKLSQVASLGRMLIYDEQNLSLQSYFFQFIVCFKETALLNSQLHEEHQSLSVHHLEQACTDHKIKLD